MADRQGTEMLQKQLNIDTPSHIKPESTDMRERESAMNPMVVETDGPGNVRDDDLERIEAQQQQQQQWAAGGEVAERGSAGQAVAVLSHDDTCMLIFWFAGVAPAPSWHSPWMLCRIGWPAAVVFGLAEQIDFTKKMFDSGAPALAYTVAIPTALAYSIALTCYFWLWPKVQNIVAREGPLPPKQQKRVVVDSLLYITVWMTLGVTLYAWNVATKQFALDVFKVIPYDAVNWIDLTATVPVLGATLLVLGIETTHANNTIQTLVQAARDKSLTRDMYKTARERIVERSKHWQLSLGTLAMVALYSTIGMVIVLRHPAYDPYITNKFEEDIFHVIFNGKETALLFVIMAKVVHTNDRADTITTVLNRDPWGEPGSKEESRRQDLLFLTTSYSIPPESTASIGSYLTYPKDGPISFKICGFRPGRDVFSAAVLSFIASVVGSLLRAYF